MGTGLHLGLLKMHCKLTEVVVAQHGDLEKAMATHSSTLAWKIPWTEEPGGLPSMGLHRVGHDWSDLAAAIWCLYQIPLKYTLKWFILCYLKFTLLKVKSEVAQSCLTLCDPMDGSLPGSMVHGIFQARILEWAAISFSRGSPQPRDQSRVSCIADGRFTIWATREAHLVKTFTQTS